MQEKAKEGMDPMMLSILKDWVARLEQENMFVDDRKFTELFPKHGVTEQETLWRSRVRLLVCQLSDAMLIKNTERDRADIVLGISVKLGKIAEEMMDEE